MGSRLGAARDGVGKWWRRDIKEKPHARIDRGRPAAVGCRAGAAGAAEAVPRSRGGYTDYVLTVNTSSGSFEMPVGEVMMRGPVERIARILDRRRIPKGYMPVIGTGRKGQTR
jgi:hypothetical protein